MHSLALNKDLSPSRKAQATSFFAQKKPNWDASRHRCLPLEAIPEFKLPRRWDEVEGLLAAAGCTHDPHLLLTRFCRSMSELMRMVRSRLPGPFWFTAQELQQAANLAERAPVDRRTTPFGKAAVDKWLRYMVAAHLLVVDTASQAFYVVGFERTHRRAFEKARARHERHAEAGRLRYHIKRDQAAPEDTRDAEFGFIWGDSVSPKRGVQIAPDMACVEHLRLSPNIYIEQQSSNHYSDDENIVPQPPAPDPDKALGNGCQERLDAFEMLSIAYGPEARALGSEEDLEDWEIEMAAKWRSRHGEDGSKAKALYRRHKQRRQTREAEPDRPPSPCQQEDPTPICGAPLRAKPLLSLSAEHAMHLKIAVSRASPRTKAHHEARLVAIETLIGALRAPPASLAELRKFWLERGWLGTLKGAPARCRPASLALWAYAADRMEADGTSHLANCPAGMLIHRVGLWVDAQLQTETRPCPSIK